MITVNLTSLLIWILLVVLIIFVCYLIAVFAKLVKTLKETNNILHDVSKVSSIAADKVEKSEEALDGLIKALGAFSQALKGNEKIVASVGNIAKAVSSVINVLKRDRKKEVVIDERNVRIPIRSSRRKRRI